MRRGIHRPRRRRETYHHWENLVVLNGREAWLDQAAIARGRAAADRELAEYALRFKAMTGYPSCWEKERH